MEHNEQNLTTNGDQFVKQSFSLEGVHAPASLVPSVLSRLRRENVSIQPGTQGNQVNQLMAALEDSDWHVRANAVRMLGELAERTPIEPVLVALNDEDESVRAAAVWALGKLDERVPVDRLIVALHDSSWVVREIAALTLGELGERAPVGVLEDILHIAGEDPYVREAAKISLQQIHSTVLSPLTSGTVMTSQAQNQDSGETGWHLYERAKSYLTKYIGLSGRLSGRNAGGYDWQEEGNIVEIPSLKGEGNSGSTPQQPVLARPKRHLALRIGEGILAALLIAGIAVSWLVLAQKLRPSFFGTSSHIRQTPTAGPTISPSLLGHDISLTLVDGVIYTGTVDKAVYALRASDGSLLWRYNTDGSVDEPLQVVNGVVYVSASVAQGPSYLVGYAYALRASDGALLWRYSRGEYVYTPTVVDGVAYVGSRDSTVSALRASDGVLLWHYTTKGPVDGSPLVVNGAIFVNANIDQGAAYLYVLRASDGRLIWSYTTPHGFVYIPTVVDGVAYIDAPEGLVALRANDGSLLWRYALANTDFSLLTVLNGIVYTIGTNFSTIALDGTSDHSGGYLLRTIAETLPSEEKVPFKSAVASVYALRASDGTLLWHYSMNNGKNNWGTFLSVVNGVVYAGANAEADKNYIYALQASNGSLLWSSSIKDAPTSALVTNGIIYRGSDSGTVYALRASDGSLLWHSTIYGTVFQMPILVGSSLYVGTSSGFVYALQASDGSLLWRYLTDVR